MWSAMKEHGPSNDRNWERWRILAGDSLEVAISDMFERADEVMQWAEILSASSSRSWCLSTKLCTNTSTSVTASGEVYENARRRGMVACTKISVIWHNIESWTLRLRRLERWVIAITSFGGSRLSVVCSFFDGEMVSGMIESVSERISGTQSGSLSAALQNFIAISGLRKQIERNIWRNATLLTAQQAEENAICSPLSIRTTRSSIVSTGSLRISAPLDFLFLDFLAIFPSNRRRPFSSSLSFSSFVLALEGDGEEGVGWGEGEERRLRLKPLLVGEWRALRRTIIVNDGLSFFYGRKRKSCGWTTGSPSRSEH